MTPQAKVEPTADDLRHYIEHAKFVGDHGTPAINTGELAAICELALCELARRSTEEAEAVGEAGSMPGSSGFTMAAFEAVKVPIGTKLYLASPNTQDRDAITDAEVEALALAVFGHNPGGMTTQRVREGLTAALKARTAGGGEVWPMEDDPIARQSLNEGIARTGDSHKIAASALTPREEMAFAAAIEKLRAGTLLTDHEAAETINAVRLRYAAQPPARAIAGEQKP